MYFTMNLTQAKGSLSVNFITYFTVIQTKTYIFHLSTLPKSICDKTTAKNRWSLPKTMFLGVETTFRHTFPSSDLRCLPPDDPRVLLANTGIRLLATPSLIPRGERKTQAGFPVRDTLTRDWKNGSLLRSRFLGCHATLPPKKRLLTSEPHSFPFVFVVCAPLNRPIT